MRESQCKFLAQEGDLGLLGIWLNSLESLFNFFFNYCNLYLKSCNLKLCKKFVQLFF